MPGYENDDGENVQEEMGKGCKKLEVFGIPECKQATSCVWGVCSVQDNGVCIPQQYNSKSMI